MNDLIHAELLKLRTTRMFCGNALAALALRARQRGHRHPDRRAARGRPGARHQRRRPQRDRRRRRRAPSWCSSSASWSWPASSATTRRRRRSSSPRTAGRSWAPSWSPSTLVGVGLAARRVRAHAGHRPAVAGRQGRRRRSSSAATSALVPARRDRRDRAVRTGRRRASAPLIRNQTAAVVVALVWVLVVEGLLVSFAPEVGRWLPGGAAARPLRRRDRRRRAAADVGRRAPVRRLRAGVRRGRHPVRHPTRRHLNPAPTGSQQIRTR